MLNRRALLSSTFAAAASAGAFRETSAQVASPVVSPQASPAAGSGALVVGGGGTVMDGEHEVTFSLSAVAVDGVVTGGSFHLSHPDYPEFALAIASISFESLTLSATGLARMVGMATMNGLGNYPLVIDLTDGGLPGEGVDELSFVFGADALPLVSDKPIQNCDCYGFGYSLRAQLTSGDLAIVQG